MPQALPGLSVSTPPARSSAAAGFLRVVSPDTLTEQDRQRAAAAAEASKRQSAPQDDLGAYIRQRWQVFRNNRNSGADTLNNRLLRAQRMFEGKYDPDKLALIQQFKGSQVYARIVAVKARTATAMLRDVYLGAERPWAIEPEPDPPVPPDIKANIVQLVSSEVQTMQSAGQPVLDDQAHMRYLGLMHAAQQAARRAAMMQADAAADKVDDILVSGRFYKALAAFLVDLPLFPFACLKGPVVRMVPKLTWVGSQPVRRSTAQMFWDRISPFDVYWSPGASRIEEAEIIERKRLTRADLNDLIGLPGYDETAIRGALQDYGRGLRDWMDTYDSEEALNEGREDPNFNQSHYIDAIEYHGNVQGSMLLAQGVDPRQIPDPDRDYSVQSWVVGRWTLKTQLNPNPRQRHPYYITSFEKVPGTIAGHALPDILEDIQEVGNATLRALVNNMAVSSGPQVVVNEDRLSQTENADDLHPWKVWRVQSPSPGDQREPVTFFQPDSNVQQLLMTYSKMTELADDLSGIPRYVTGESLSGGAGRTASGLGMLMGNAEKILQTVASNVDGDVLDPVLSGLYDMIMLTDTSGMLSGQEAIRVSGVDVAIQKETERQRQLQFLQITANPLDAPIVGELGRARVLRAVASGLGLPDDIVPDDKTIQDKMQAQQQVQAAGAAMVAAAGGQPGPPGQPGQPGPPGPPGQPGGSAAPTPASQAQGSQAPSPRPASPADHAPPVNSFSQGISPNG